MTRGPKPGPWRQPYFRACQQTRPSPLRAAPAIYPGPSGRYTAVNPSMRGARQACKDRRRDRCRGERSAPAARQRVAIKTLPLESPFRTGIDGISWVFMGVNGCKLGNDVFLWDMAGMVNAYGQDKSAAATSSWPPRSAGLRPVRHFANENRRLLRGGYRALDADGQDGRRHGAQQQPVQERHINGRSRSFSLYQIRC